MTSLLEMGTPDRRPSNRPAEGPPAKVTELDMHRQDEKHYVCLIYGRRIESSDVK